ncbi:MAG TPA: hypothetical protein VIL64_03280 [Solirubrobacteraceae bacterium]
MPTGRLVALVVVVVGLALAGCGGSSHGRAKGGGESASERADARAYYVVATSSGMLRAEAATLVVRHRRLDRYRRKDIARRLAAVAPRDRDLRAARAALRAALDSPPRAALRATSAVNRILARYAKRHPEVVGLLPD